MRPAGATEEGETFLDDTASVAGAFRFSGVRVHQRRSRWKCFVRCGAFLFGRYVPLMPGYRIAIAECVAREGGRVS